MPIWIDVFLTKKADQISGKYQPEDDFLKKI